jgi:hypothetical protein
LGRRKHVDPNHLEHISDWESGLFSFLKKKTKKKTKKQKVKWENEFLEPVEPGPEDVRSVRPWTWDIMSRQDRQIQKKCHKRCGIVGGAQRVQISSTKMCTFTKQTKTKNKHRQIALYTKYNNKIKYLECVKTTFSFSNYILTSFQCFVYQTI